MTNFKDISNIYFIGVGGIGMSALARYFIAGGYSTAGYDRSITSITADLTKEGCVVSNSDDPGEIPGEFLNNDETIVIYTPAIPGDSRLMNYFRHNNYRLFKRAEILGLISSKSRTLAIAGTHGKTSISTLTAHLIKQSSMDCSAFLGGIARNYNSNLLIGESDIVVVEADEFDRSFHHLRPVSALVSSLDPDHLDVYGNLEGMISAYKHFLTLVSDGGSVVVHKDIIGKLDCPVTLKMYTYGLHGDADFSITNIKRGQGKYTFDITTPSGIMKDLVSLMPGRMNLENTLGAVAMATLAGVKEDEIRKSLLVFRGVKRRFDIRYESNDLTYIDDYAHHPRELDYLISSVREFYGDRRITVVFQPHLYTRTLDHYKSFAGSLDKADRVILLPVYPAREKPIEGVGSHLILEAMSCPDKLMVNKEDLIDCIASTDKGILLTVGAGDIDGFVLPIEEMLKKRIV